MRGIDRFPAVAAWLVCLASSSLALAADPPKRAGKAADIAISQAVVPFSALASKEAHAEFERMLGAPRAPDFSQDIDGARRFYGEFNDQRLVEMRASYSVTNASETMGGVRVDVVQPSTPIPKRNRYRVLINVHGGAFMWGAGSGALVEAIPIAATGHIKVVTVDYRMAPEYKYPAASEDVAAVYKELLKTYRPENIGIYGCSAGGILTAESVAWFAAHDLPRPGAIAMLCASGAGANGDSAFLAPVLTGEPPLPADTKPEQGLMSLPYFSGASANDPLVLPATSNEVLARFPPTLLIVGGRDFAASSMTRTHRRLRAAGVSADLFVFDGMWHAFFIYPKLPESRETYLIMARFFDRHLGRLSP
jgi:acetyl esterase/lipase